MSVVASLVPGQSYKTQIVVDEIPAGVSWRLVGHVGGYTEGLVPSDVLTPSDDVVPLDSVFTPGAYSWVVPGGFGVGDGGQVVLVDSRSPGNVPVSYTLETDEGTESSHPVVVPFERDVVLQTLDGLASVDVELMAGSLGMELEPQVAHFRVPGRARPVVRYDVLGDVSAALVVKVPMGQTAALRNVLTSGRPIVYRFGAPEGSYDLDPVGVVSVTAVSSEPVPTADLRFWTLEYTLVDDPDFDVRLGAFTWADFNAAFAGRTWADFNAAFAGSSWADFNRADWTVV